MTEECLRQRRVSTSTLNRPLWAILIVLSLCAVAMTLVATARYGAGMSPDTSGYFAAARSLLAGKGFIAFDHRVYTQWPPLFPTLLAALYAVGLEPAVGARYLNALAFGATVLVSGLLLAGSVRSKAFIVLGAASVAFAAPLLWVSMMAWSEPVFILLMTLFALLLVRFAQAPRLSTLLLVSIVAALACLQRYAGVALILAGSVLVPLATSKISIRRRVLDLMIFGVVSSLPLALWLLRNRMTGEMVGGHTFRPVSIQEWVQSALIGVEMLVPWFFTERVPAPARLIAVGLILFVAAALAVVALARFSDRRRERVTCLSIAAVVGIVYFGFLALAAAGLGWPLEPRLIAPIYVLVMVLVATGAEAGIQLIQAGTGGRKGPMVAGVVVCALWLLYPLSESRIVISRAYHHGPYGYATAPWKNSEMIAWMREHPLNGTIYSNVPNAVFLLTGQSAEISPHNYWSPAEAAARMAEFETPQEYLVWSYLSYWDYLYDLRELLSRYRTEEIASFKDGKIYRLLGESDGPPAFGVFRLWSAVKNKHVYAVTRAERDQLLADRSQAWVDEGPIFYVYHSPEPNTVGVHRLRSAGRDTQLLVADPGKRENLLADGTDWTDDGTVFFVATKPLEEDFVPVYDLWSDSLDDYFYTARQKEIDLLTGGGSDIWTVGGIVWYAYGPPQ